MIVLKSESLSICVRHSALGLVIIEKSSPCRQFCISTAILRIFQREQYDARYISHLKDPLAVPEMC